MAKKRTPRILVHGPLPPPLGGMGSYCADYLKTSLVSDFDVTFCRSTVVRAIHRTRGLLCRLLRVVNMFCITAVWLAMLIVKRRDVAHIHTNSYAGFYIRAALGVWARIFFVPTVLHIHGAEFKEFYRGRSRPAKWLVRRFLNANSRVIVLSEQWREFFSSIGVSDSRLVVMTNSVFLPELTPRDRSADKISVVFMSLFEKRKGVLDIVDAVAGSATLKDSCRFVLAGPKKQEWDTVAKQVAERALSEVIELPGAVIDDAKAEAYRDAEIYLLPSYAEGLPIGLLEAMSYGLACVTTPVGGIPDLVDDGENGLLVPPGDVGALAAAIERLVADEGLRRRLGQSARETVERGYAWQARACELGQLYRELAG